MFLNLLVNAAQALPEGRVEHDEIHVVTRSEGDWVIIEVSDTGPGIAPEVLGRVFDAFFTTKPVGVGMGLGGQLTVESEIGRGTTFRVSLPAARDDQVTAALLTPPPVAARRGRILVIDDASMILRSLERVLGRDHDVVGVTSGSEALGLFTRGDRFDLVLCDLMPHVTGMELHREASVVAPDQADRMIFLTGGTFTNDARQFLAQTVQEHIEKPFDVANVRKMIVVADPGIGMDPETQARLLSRS